MSEDMNQGHTFEILTAEPVRKRRKPKLWSEEAKALILEQALAPGANVSAVARAHGMDPSQLFGWRRAALASGSVQRLKATGDNEAFTRFEAVRTDSVEM
jgi:transposase